MLTALDQIANQNHLQLIKAAIPYIASENQKTLSVLVKMAELYNVMNFYKHGDFSVNACSAQTEQPDMLDILTDIRNHCEEDEQAFLDQWIQIISAMELYSVFAQSPEGSDHEP